MKRVLQIEHPVLYKMEMAPEKCPERSVPHSLGRGKESVYAKCSMYSRNGNILQTVNSEEKKAELAWQGWG